MEIKVNKKEVFSEKEIKNIKKFFKEFEKLDSTDGLMYECLMDGLKEFIKLKLSKDNYITDIEIIREYSTGKIVISYREYKNQKCLDKVIYL